MSLLPRSIKALIIDMDGVLWTGDSPIGNLSEIFKTISDRKLEVCLATNNATRTPQQYLERLREFSVTGLEPWQIVTSGHALANELEKRFPDRGEVYVIGEEGLCQALIESGFEVIDENKWHASRNIVAIAVGMDRSISFPKLRRATLLIRAGIPFYATNPDRTFPTPEGLIPGAGALIAALVAASGIEPIVVGKPAPFMIHLACERLRVPHRQTLVVGDRLETDIAGGQAAGCPVALVLSGVSTKEMAVDWDPMPDIIAPDLVSLIE
jgi:4-nitrophenyl phosphatase